MVDTNYLNLVKILEHKTKINNYNGVQIIEKLIPDLNIDGELDPRVYKIINASSPTKKYKSDNEFIYHGINISELRSSMGWNNRDITSKEILSEYLTVIGKNGPIKVRKYTPKNLKDNAPCMIFIHGGGFIGGNVDVVENPCKALSDKANAVVISIDYRLAPENQFPKGLIDCFEVIKWVYSNSTKLKIKKDKICISGDSAGGNLAVACSLKDRDLKTNIIKYQALIYPVVTLDKKSVEQYKWSSNEYIFSNNKINQNINSSLDFIDIIKQLYVEDTAKPDNQYISPLLAKDLSNLPKTLIITAEYDFLRVQGEAFGKKLINAKVDTKIIRYRGMDHAFIDKCGIYPQAEDCLNEISKDIKSL
ncbi:alpha/beta hydrolase [Clostridium butyricum]|uniref:alpha/beta hydrolase n=1 Tax=Clostridium butyricum TaxID=1492 RepID=UPI000413EED3|nr:alpha/beta hydrolase [Clostridium butyricum]